MNDLGHLPTGRPVVSCEGGIISASSCSWGLRDACGEAESVENQSAELCREVYLGLGPSTSGVILAHCLSSLRLSFTIWKLGKKIDLNAYGFEKSQVFLKIF